MKVELLEVLVPTLLSVVTIVVSYAGAKIGAYYNLKVSKDKQEQIDNIINSSVVWVEQITGVDVEYEAIEKFNFAKNRALELLKGAGLEVSEEYLDTLIEVFVNGLHSDRVNELESHINKIMGDEKNEL